MPLSDNLRYFLQHVGMSPEQQAQERQQQAMAARMSDQFAQTQAYNQQKLQADSEEAFLRAQTSLVPYGYNLQRGGGAATQQGGAGLNDTRPSTMEAPGAPSPRGDGPPPTSTDELMEKLMPGWGQFQGQQQQGGMGVNQPGQMPQGGPMTPSMRMPGMSGDSGGGGAAQPAAAKPVMPTMQSILSGGQYGGQPYNITKMPSAGEDDPEITLPDIVAKIHGSPTIKASQAKIMAPIWDTIIKAQTGKAPKELTEPEREEQWAAQAVARENKVPNAGKIEKIIDLPPEFQQAAIDRRVDNKAGEIGRETKAAVLAKKQDDEQKFKEARASDSAVMNLLQRDPMYFNHKNISDKDQYNRILLAAQQQGMKLPTREIKEKMATKGEIADEIQLQSDRIGELAKQIGPQAFGAIIGRMKSAEGDWGSQAFTNDPRLASLEQEMRAHIKALTAQEVQMFGGGRTAVMLYNIMKSATPQQYQSQPLFQGALRATWNRAQQSKNAIRRYAFGEGDEPQAMKELSSGNPSKTRFVGERIQLKDGSEGRIKTLLPSGKYELE